MHLTFDESEWSGGVLYVTRSSQNPIQTQKRATLEDLGRHGQVIRFLRTLGAEA